MGTKIQLDIGDCYEVMRGYDENSIDALITDPPYGLGDEPDPIELLRSWVHEGKYEASGGGFMGRCFHPDTDILTEDGWKPVAEVSTEDRCYSLNPDTDEIEFVSVTKTYDYDYEGDLVRIAGRSVEQIVTPNHKVFINSAKNWRLVAAQDIPQNFRMKNQGNWRGEMTDKIQIGGSEYDADSFFWFIGLFLGDGFTVNRVAQPEKQDFMGFACKKARKKEAFSACLDQLGVKFTETPGEDEYISYYVYDKDLLAYLKPLGSAQDKYIPPELFGYSRDLLDHLYRGMIQTDGCVQGYNDQEVYFTASEQLANDFQRLCFLTGRSCVLNQRERTTTFSEGPEYETKGWVASVVQPEKVFWLEKVDHKNPDRGNYELLPYTGKVHCCELEQNHILLSRFNGRTVWSGNSWDATVPGPLVWKEALRVLKPGGEGAVFAGTRTLHLMMASLRIAGFDIKGVWSWTYGSGFPKNHSVHKALLKKVDERYGEERCSCRGSDSYREDDYDPEGSLDPDRDNERRLVLDDYEDNDLVTRVCSWCALPDQGFIDSTEGLGTALKPAWEPIIRVTKPDEPFEVDIEDLLESYGFDEDEIQLIMTPPEDT